MIIKRFLNLSKAPQVALSGLSLTELLISLSLLGTVILGYSMFIIKISGSNDAYRKLGQADIELNSLYMTMQKQLENAGWIDPTSYNKKIVFTTLDQNGNATKIGYRITTLSGKNVLEYSANGVTWGNTPYNLSASSTYNMDVASNAPEFLYCGYSNNCTRFQDSVTVNDQWDSGEGRVQASGSILLSTASAAKKVILSGFNFNRQMGNPPVKRTWPDLLARLSSSHVSTTTSLVQKFSTVPGAGNNFSTGLNLTGIAYQTNSRRLVAVGGDTGGTDNFVYQLTRDGIALMSVTNTGNIEFDDVCVDADGTTAWTALWSSGTLRHYDLSTGSGTVLDTITFVPTNAAYFNTSGSATALACDPSVSNKLFILGRTNGGVQSILPVTLNTGTDTATPGTRVTLATAMNGGTSEAMLIDPATGDFYALQQALSGADPNKTMTIQHISFASPTTSDPFSINISNLQSPSPASAVGWGMAFDTGNNHLFIADSTTDMIYEFAPPRLLSPKL